MKIKLRKTNTMPFEKLCALYQFCHMQHNQKHNQQHDIILLFLQISLKGKQVKFW